MDVCIFASFCLKEINSSKLFFFRVVEGTMSSTLLLLLILCASLVITTIADVTVDVEKRVNPHDTEKGKVDALVIKGYDTDNFRDDQFKDEIVIYAVDNADANDPKNSLWFQYGLNWIEYFFNGYDETANTLKFTTKSATNGRLDPKIARNPNRFWKQENVLNLTPEQLINDFIKKNLVGRRDSMRSKEHFAKKKKGHSYGNGDEISIIKPPLIEINDNVLDSDKHRQKVSIYKDVLEVAVKGFDRTLFNNLRGLSIEGHGTEAKMSILSVSSTGTRS